MTDSATRQVRGKLTLRTRPGRQGGIAGLCIVKNNTLTIRAESRSQAASQADDDELVLAVRCFEELDCCAQLRILFRLDPPAT